MSNIDIMYSLATDLLLLIITLTKDEPVLSSERAPHMEKQ
jgi:hypothetical protein